MKTRASRSWAEEFHGRRMKIGGVALWAAAALMVAGAHAGGVALMLRHAPEPIAEDAAAPALMLELAPMSEAVNTETSNITDQMQDSQEVKPAEPEPLPEPEPEPVVEEEPPPLPEPEPEIVEEEIPDEIETPVEQAEVVIPRVRPRERPEPEEKVVEKREEPRKERQEKPRRKEPPSQASTAAAAQVQQSNRNAGAQTAAGAGSSVSPAKWRSRLMAHLERRKRYPAASRAKREEGVVHIRFTIDAAGTVLSSAIARSSGFPDIDNAALDMVRRSSPVPPPPPGESHTISAPIRFNLR